MWMMKKIYKLICNIKKDSVSNYLLNNFFFDQFVNNFSALSCKSNVPEIFYGDFFSDFYCIAKY